MLVPLLSIQDKIRYLDQLGPILYATSTINPPSSLNTQLVRKDESGLLPPILTGRATPVVRERVSEFLFS